MFPRPFVGYVVRAFEQDPIVAPGSLGVADRGQLDGRIAADLLRARAGIGRRKIHIFSAERHALFYRPAAFAQGVIDG